MALQKIRLVIGEGEGGIGNQGFQSVQNFISFYGQFRQGWGGSKIR